MKMNKEYKEIDKDVLETMAKESLSKITNNPVLMKRALLNAMAEMLSEFKHLNQSHEEFVNILTILSNEKIQEFFYEVKKNKDEVEKEEVDKTQE